MFTGSSPRSGSAEAASIMSTCNFDDYFQTALHMNDPSWPFQQQVKWGRTFRKPQMSENQGLLWYLMTPRGTERLGYGPFWVGALCESLRLQTDGLLGDRPRLSFLPLLLTVCCTLRPQMQMTRGSVWAYILEMEPHVLWPLRGAPGEKLSQGTGLIQTPLKREMDNLQKRDNKWWKHNRRQRASCNFTHTWCWWNTRSHLWKFATWRFTRRGLTACLLSYFVTAPHHPHISLLISLDSTVQSLPAKLLQSCPTLCNPTRLLCPGDSPGKHTGVGCRALLHSSHRLPLHIPSTPSPGKAHPGYMQPSSFPIPAPDWQNMAGEEHASPEGSHYQHKTQVGSYISYKSPRFLLLSPSPTVQEHRLHQLLAP